MPLSPRQVQVVQGAISGDPEALGELYDLYGAAVYLVTNRIMACPEDAEDVVQDVFLGLPRLLFSPRFKITAVSKDGSRK